MMNFALQMMDSALKTMKFVLKMMDFAAPSQVLQALLSAFGKYQAKNLLILFDAVATLAEAVGEALAHPDIVSALVPAVLARWEACRDDERTLIPCTECLSALTGVMGELMLPYVEPLYGRIMRLVHARTTALADPNLDPPEFEYPCVNLDLLSSMLEALGTQMMPLLESTGGIAVILTAASNDPHTEMKRVLFAVIGDLAKSCWELLGPHAAQVLPLLLDHFNPSYVAACNNATWAVGEIVTQIGTGSDLAFLSQVVARLSPILAPYNPHTSRIRYHRTVVDTASITLGRLAEVSAATVAGHPELESSLLEGWCCALRNSRDGDDKEHATQGLLAVLQANPAAAAGKVGFVCDVFCSWSLAKLQVSTRIPPLKFHRIRCVAL